MGDVVGVGALNKDLFFEVTPKQLLSINGELDKPFVLGKEDADESEKFEQTIQTVKKYAKDKGQALGGSATQTMVALSRMGVSTGCLGMVGYDNHLLEIMLRKEEIYPMLFVGRYGSGECISVSNGKDRALRENKPNSNDLFSPQLLNKAPYILGNLSSYKIIHMTPFVCSLGDGPLDAQTKIAEEFAGKVMISFGPGEFYANRGLKALQPILWNTNVLFLNRGEMKILTGEDYKEGSRKLLEKLPHYRPHYVVCTLGKDGLYLRYDGHEFLAEPIKIPKKEIKPEGLTGAGDYCAAGFIAGMLKQLPPESCANLGNKVARMKLRGMERGAYQKIEI